MKKSRLVQVFQTLSKWEIRHFRQFLASPYFNSREDVIRLLAFLVEEQEKEDPPFLKEDAFHYVYPQDTYKESKRYLVASYLFKLLEEFLAIHYIKNNDSTMKLYQVKAYGTKKLKTNFERSFDSLKDTQEKQDLRDSNYLREAYDLELEYYNYLGSQSRYKENNLAQVSNFFDIYYIAEKLKQYCLQWAHKTVFKKEYSVGLQEGIMQFISQHEELLEYPVIEIYYNCYQAISTGDEKYFERLIAATNAHADKFTSAEIGSIYKLTINYCIKRLNAGNVSYNRWMFELYRDGVENEFLLIKGEITAFTYKNIAMLGMKLNEFDYVEHFIRAYADLLPESNRTNLYNFTMASLHFEKNEYREAMKLLATFDSKDHLLNLNAKATLLKMLYELKEIDALEALIDSLRVYINRKEIIGYHKIFYKELISIVAKLISLTPGDKKTKTLLNKRILEIKITSMREWLLEQLEKKK